MKITLTRLAMVLVFLACWEATTALGWLSPFSFGQPSGIFADLWGITVTGYAFIHLWITLEEALLGLLLGGAAGVAVAFGLAVSPFWSLAMGPILMVLYGIPRIALAPLFILWFGLGVASKVVFALVLVFFLLLFNTLAGLKGVSCEMVDALGHGGQPVADTEQGDPAGGDALDAGWAQIRSGHGPPGGHCGRVRRG